MGQHSQPRHAKTITRDDLLHRYANAMSMTYGKASDLNAHRSMDELRDRLEEIETGLGTAPPGRRRSFARSQPTTTVQGQTR